MSSLLVLLSLLKVISGYTIFSSYQSGYPLYPYTYSYTRPLLQHNFGVYPNVFFSSAIKSPLATQVRGSSETVAFAKPLEDPCQSSPCGSHSSCFSRAGSAVCTCPQGWTGDAYAATGCHPPTCRATADCGVGQACHDGVCVQACSARSCGLDAECLVLGHKTRQCFCPAGYTGNPLVKCSAIIQESSEVSIGNFKIAAAEQLKPGIVQEVQSTPKTSGFQNSKISPVLKRLRAKTRGVQPSGVLVV